MTKFIWPAIGLFIILGLLNASWLFYQNNKIPTLGAINGKLKPLPNTFNAISSQTEIKSKHVEPLIFKGDLNQSKQRIIQMLSHFKEATLITEEHHYLYFVFKSKGLGFKDDVEFYFNEESQNIDYRSSSRAGNYDLGKNKQRYHLIKNRWNE